jgi:V-type H+-transporting ATPase subunit a
MLALFGYMDFLIFVKWATEYKIEAKDGKAINYTAYAPDIKSYLMSIFLNFGKLPNPPIINGANLEWKLLTSTNKMEKIHLGILICSLFCMILMFFPKIFINYCKAKKKYSNRNNFDKIGNNFQEQLIPQKELEEPAFSNFFVECAIETIEFVLGTVSNTASYLRLWALSLAHSQLAVVFFSKTVALFGNSSDKWYINGVLLLLIFPIFAGATAIVLLFMDVMECFLHTLRLHWVEFQNKFYKADGYQFKPFYFPNNISLIDEEYIGKGE